MDTKDAYNKLNNDYRLAFQMYIDMESRWWKERKVRRRNETALTVALVISVIANVILLVT